MYALVARFALNEGQGEPFDSLTRETLALIGTDEPGTLFYACHTVPGDVNARVFYELYRDRDAFDAHESRDYIVRFRRERAQYLAAEPTVELLDLQDGKGITGAV